jgi:STAS domain
MAGLPTTIELDASALPADLLTVDALARLQVSARRHGRQLRLVGTSDDLQGVIDLVGLSAVLRTSAANGRRLDRLDQTDALGVEPRRQAEQREQRGGVEEERELDDPAV